MDTNPIITSIYEPHIYIGYGHSPSRGRYGVDILNAPERDRPDVPYALAAVELLASYWAVVDDFGRLIKVANK